MLTSDETLADSLDVESCMIWSKVMTGAIGSLAARVLFVFVVPCQPLLTPVSLLNHAKEPERSISHLYNCAPTPPCTAAHIGVRGDEGLP